MNEENKTTNEEVIAEEAVGEEAVTTEDAAAGEEGTVEAEEAAAEEITEPVPTPEEVNAANAERSTGKVDDDGQGAAFFTSADVRAMSREQVRQNLDKILRSMESDKF